MVVFASSCHVFVTFFVCLIILSQTVVWLYIKPYNFVRWPAVYESVTDNRSRHHWIKIIGIYEVYAMITVKYFYIDFDVIRNFTGVIKVQNVHRQIGFKLFHQSKHTVKALLGFVLMLIWRQSSHMSYTNINKKSGKIEYKFPDETDDNWEWKTSGMRQSYC